MATQQKVTNPCWTIELEHDLGLGGLANALNLAAHKALKLMDDAGQSQTVEGDSQESVCTRPCKLELGTILLTLAGEPSLSPSEKHLWQSIP